MPVLVLMDGASRVDLERVRAELGAATVSRANADTVRETTGYAIGGVPPFGHRTRTRVLADRGLLAHGTVWAAAGTPHTVFPLDPKSLVEHARGPHRGRARAHRMTPLVVAAVLLAAVTHASWNAIAHGIRDQLLAFTLVGGGGALCGAVLAGFAPLPAAAAWPYLLGSAVLHVVYQALLMRSFRLGDFGQMYPIARGTAPLVVTVLAAVFVGEIPDGWALAGVALASAGLVGVALWGIRGSGTRPHWPAIIAALATGLAIAAYTTVDGLGVRASGTPLGYIAWLMILEGLAIPAYAPRHPPPANSPPSSARSPLRGLLGGGPVGLRLRPRPLGPDPRRARPDRGPARVLHHRRRRDRGPVLQGALRRPRIAAAGLMVVGHRPDAGIAGELAAGAVPARVADVCARWWVRRVSAGTGGFRAAGAAVSPGGGCGGSSGTGGLAAAGADVSTCRRVRRAPPGCVPAEPRLPPGASGPARWGKVSKSQRAGRRVRPSVGRLPHRVASRPRTRGAGAGLR